MHAVVIPVYGHWDYAEACARSLRNASPEVLGIVIDDCSPQPAPQSFIDFLRKQKWVFHRNKENRQLTAVWNCGLVAARRLKADIITVANSDLLFSRGWHAPIETALAKGWHLVGPVTNAPGMSALQNVEKHCEYSLSDEPELIEHTAECLRQARKGKIIASKINGFCMTATTQSWFTGAFSPDTVFRPRNDVMPSGRKNSTPLMTGNEDELQHRWEALQRRFAVVCDSFVFHYRSVTRGKAFCKGRWMRR